MIRVGSDFSGVGAFDQALMRLGIDYKTVFSCDMDKFARKSYVANYGEPQYYPENVYDRIIPAEPLDIYMTSPPCQAFSLAGKRKGEDDKRGISFYNSHEFIKINNPRYFIFENVKGLLSDDNGKTFQRWCDFLGGKSINGNPVIFPHEESVPYHIYYSVLNAKNYGIPQNRERVFIIGIRDDSDNVFSFPKPFELKKRLKDVLEQNVDIKYYLKKAYIYKITKSNFNQERNRLQDKDICDTLLSRDYKDPKCIKVVNVNVVANLPGKHEQNSRIYGVNGIAPTLTTMGGGNQEPKIICENVYIRKLTPRECFRLMDFPDSFKMVASDSQLYKQAGNSICVGVLAAIINNLKL